MHTPAPLPDAPVILYDGVCRFCHYWVQWVMRHDTRRQFYFATLQSVHGQGFLQQHGLSPTYLQSVVVIDKGRAYTHSTAALQILKKIGRGWAFVYYLLILLPASLRDSVYHRVSRNRYRWFGVTNQCIVPSTAWKEHFL